MSSFFRAVATNDLQSLRARRANRDLMAVATERRYDPDDFAVLLGQFDVAVDNGSKEVGVGFQSSSFP
ncbi:MAG: hypothetical protein WAL25_05045 [Acidimicrobiia bacterium]